MRIKYLVPAIVVPAALIGTLVFLMVYYYPEIRAQEDNPSVIRIPQGVAFSINYSQDVVSLIEGLPTKNSLIITSSSELFNTEIRPVNGDLNYSDFTIAYTQRGEIRQEDQEQFNSIRYRFDPDPGTNSTYTYENVNYTMIGSNNRLEVAFEQLPTAEVGDRYSIQLSLKSGMITYQMSERIIEITR